MDRFVNKIAVVTGSNQGNGAAILIKLVQHGIIVVGLDKNIDKLKELQDSKYPGKVHALICDISNESEVKSSFKWVTEKLGPIYILVNNAGVFFPSLITDTTGDLISRTFDINVKGAILCAKEALNSMIENSVEGHIININSSAGQYVFLGNPPVFTVYTGSKHALRIVSEGLRQEIVHKNLSIKVTNLSPGYVNTGMTAAVTDYVPKPKSNKEALESTDIADACAYVLNTPPNVLELTAELSDVKKYPGKFHTLKCDVNSESEVKFSFKWIKDNLGYVSVLINNAGVLFTGALIGILFYFTQKNSIKTSIAS